MKFEEKVELVSVLCEDIKKLHKVQNRGEKLFGLFTDGCKYGDVVNQISDNYVKATAKLIGDNGEWLFWYIYDSDFGKKNGLVEINEKEYRIKTVEQLIDMIEGKHGEEVETND